MACAFAIEELGKNIKKTLKRKKERKKRVYGEWTNRDQSQHRQKGIKSADGGQSKVLGLHDMVEGETDFSYGKP